MPSIQTCHGRADENVMYYDIFKILFDLLATLQKYEVLSRKYGFNRLELVESPCVNEKCFQNIQYLEG